VERDLPIDHVLLALPHLAHIGSDLTHQRAEAGGVPRKVGNPGAPQLVFGRHTGHGWTRAADPAALDHDNLLAGPAKMPGEVFAALAAPEDDDIKIFLLGHGCFLPDDMESVGPAHG